MMSSAEIIVRSEGQETCDCVCVKLKEAELCNNQHGSNDILPTYESLVTQIINDPPPDYRAIMHITVIEPV